MLISLFQENLSRIEVRHFFLQTAPSRNILDVSKAEDIASASAAKQDVLPLKAESLLLDEVVIQDGSSMTLRVSL